MSKQPTFYMPTGRMRKNQPTIQMLPSPGESVWQKTLEEIHALQDKSVLTGKTFTVSRQEKALEVGELVVWSPEGRPGLWEIAAVRYQDGPNYTNIERELARHGFGGNPCNEMTLSEAGKTVLVEKYLRAPVPAGKARIVWVAGHGGYSDYKGVVVVKIAELERPNEMEAIAIAAQ